MRACPREKWRMRKGKKKKLHRVHRRRNTEGTEMWVDVQAASRYKRRRIAARKDFKKEKNQRQYPKDCGTRGLKENGPGR